MYQHLVNRMKSKLNGLCNAASQGTKQIPSCGSGVMVTFLHRGVPLSVIVVTATAEVSPVMISLTSGIPFFTVGDCSRDRIAFPPPRQPLISKLPEHCRHQQTSVSFSSPSSLLSFFQRKLATCVSVGSYNA